VRLASLAGESMRKTQLTIPAAAVTMHASTMLACAWARASRLRASRKNAAVRSGYPLK
jgi:hypothetical protein